MVVHSARWDVNWSAGAVLQEHGSVNHAQNFGVSGNQFVKCLALGLMIAQHQLRERRACNLDGLTRDSYRFAPPSLPPAITYIKVSIFFTKLKHRAKHFTKNSYLSKTYKFRHTTCFLISQETKAPADFSQPFFNRSINNREIQMSHFAPKPSFSTETLGALLRQLTRPVNRPFRRFAAFLAAFFASFALGTAAQAAIVNAAFTNVGGGATLFGHV